MESMINRDFPGMAQRGIYYFLATYPPFYPARKVEAVDGADNGAASGAVDGAAGAALRVKKEGGQCCVSEDVQKAAYDFIYKIYKNAYDDPSLLGFKKIPDDCFKDWEFQKNKPGLAGKIRDIIIKTESFIETLYNISLSGRLSGDSFIVESGEFSLKPAQIKLMENFSMAVVTDGEGGFVFTFPEGVAAGLELLARISGARSSRAMVANSEAVIEASNAAMSKKAASKPWVEAANAQKPYMLFSRGVFNPDEPWTANVFDKMFAAKSTGVPSAFARLIRFLDDNGYVRVDNRSSENRMARVSLDYVKDYTGGGEPLKWAWGERTHGGIEVIYLETNKDQPQISLRVPYFAELLRHAGDAPEQVREFILRTAKKCDNCRYCVQTDKTGAKPLKYVMLEGYPVCPLFCGFQFRWKSIDDALADNFMAMLMFIDEIFKGGSPGEAALKRWAK